MFNLYQQEIENIIILFINIKNSKNSRCYAQGIEPCYREKEKASNLNKNRTVHGDIRRWCVGCYGTISNPIV